MEAALVKILKIFFRKIKTEISSSEIKNVFREFCTVHTPSKKNGMTIIGDNNFFMVNTHIAHDCLLHDKIIIANNTALGGFVQIDSNAFLSAGLGIHQYCRVGAFAMIGGTAKGIIQDVPPFVTVSGPESIVQSLNFLGMTRGGISQDERTVIKAAFKILYYENSFIKKRIRKDRENYFKRFRSLHSALSKSFLFN